VRSILSASRFLAFVAVIGLAATTMATFGWSIAKSVQFVADLATGGWKEDGAVVQLLEVIDTYLLAIVQLIVVIGIYELFIGSLDVPDWLHAKSLDDLKKSIVDVLIVYVGVKGVEGLIKRSDPSEALTYTGAVAILIGSLTLFRIAGSYGKSGEAKTSAGAAARKAAQQQPGP
jgi:uncharacterized membrane protein YqhA